MYVRDFVYRGYCGKCAIYYDIYVLCVINVSCAMIHVVAKAKKTKKITWEGALPCARTITHGKDGGLPCAMVITHGKLACQGAYAKPGKGVCHVPAWWHTEKIQSLPCATMQAHGKPSFQENPKIFYKSLPCALLSSRQRFTVCNTRQTLPSGYPTSVSRRQSLFFAACQV